MIGIITAVNKDKGYGFLSTPDLPFTRIFFHWSALINNTLHFKKVEKGMKAEFEVQEHEPDKYRAVRMRIIE